MGDSVGQDTGDRKVAPGRRGGPARVLVTGVTGQDGSYLAERLVAEGALVFGLVLASDTKVPEGVRPLVGDLRDEGSIAAAVAVARPDEVYNLAAATFVPASWDDPAGVDDVNGAGVERLVRVLVAAGGTASLCHASTAEVFGPPTGRPQSEDCALAPDTPYGQAKARAHRCVAEARRSGSLRACSAILFNHESPRRPPSFVTRKITRAAARIARGLDESLPLGSLDAARDWGYAPEYVDAMVRMARCEDPRDYVVATGRAATVRDFAELAFARVGLDWRRHVVVDEGLVRGRDAAARIGDPARIRRDLGWAATTTLEELVAIMVDADLAAIDAGRR